MANKPKLIGYTPTLGNALQRLIEKTPKSNVAVNPYKPLGKANVIPAAVVAGTGRLSYNGYFTIKLKEEDGNTYVVVCDGATWNEENETSSGSLIYVNNRYYIVPTYKHPTPITTSTSIAIHWKNAIPADRYATPPVVATPATVNVFFTNYPLPQDSPTEIYRQIGRIYCSNGGVTQVIQDHTSGVMYAVVYAICSYK